MKKILLILFAMSIGLLVYAQEPLAGGGVYKINGTTGGSGATRTFATLRSAITYVNTNGLTGSGQAVLEFSTGYTSENISSRITINALAGASATLGLTIRPATGMNVSLTSSTVLIELNNADYTTIDGRPGGAGTTSALSLENTSLDGSSQTGVVRLVNDAQFNRFCYLTFKTAGTQNYNSGAIMLQGTTGTLGNTDNIINNNIFTFASTYVVGNAPVPQVSSTGSAAVPNKNTQILDNKFEYWGGYGAITSLNDGGWQIKNNHFYNTFSSEPLVDNGSVSHFSAIYLNGDGGGGHTIEGNFIGGKALNAGGAKMEMRANTVQLIYVNGNSATNKTIIQNNTIANINATTRTTGTVTFRGIYAAGSQMVDLLNNNIGSTSVANSLVMNKNTTGTTNYYLIQADNTGSSASNINNNTLSNLQLNEAVGATSANFYGIYSNLGTGNKIIDNNTINKISTAGRIGAIGLIYASQLAEITNNKIGSQSTTDDIMLTSTVSTSRYLIYASGDFASKVTGNQIGGVTVKSTLATAAPFSFYIIYAGGSLTIANLKNVENNLVGGTVANSIQSVAGGGAGQASVYFFGIYNQDANNKSNTIRNITANEHGYINGISSNGTIGGIVQDNIIEQLAVNSAGTNSYVAGINSATASTVPVNANTVSGLKSNDVTVRAAGTSTFGNWNVIGIFAGATTTHSGNIVYNLEASGAGTTSVVGIATREGTSLLKNRIFDIKSNNGTVGARMAGIALMSSGAGTFTAANNVVHLNHSGIADTYGVLSEYISSAIDPASQVNAYYNTILLEGTGSGTAISSAIYRSNASPLDLKNNLLFNNRSGGSGIHSLYGASNTAPAWVSDYNFLATVSSNTNVGNWNGTAQNFAAWKAGHSGQDVNSINDLSLTPSTFFDMVQAPNSFLRVLPAGRTKIGNMATTVAVTDDVLGTTRAATPTIGAFEEMVISPLQGGIVYKINGTDGGNGPSRTFATLRSASVFANTYGLSGTGQAILEFTAPYSNETIGATSIVFNSLNNASATLGLTIRPATGMTVALTENQAGLSLIDLNNADYITFDGRAGGTGTISAFSLENTSTVSTSGTGVVRFRNDAQFNKLDYLTFKTAAGINSGSGAVSFGSSSAGTIGNTNNIISNNTFTFASTYVVGNAPGSQIASNTSAPKSNDNNQVLNNKFEYWGGLGAIYNINGANWQISNNHFYNTYATQPLVADGTNPFSAIYIGNSLGGHIIDGNFIGGKAPNAGSAKMEITAQNVQLIYITGLSAAGKSTIQNNTITNINVSTPSGSTASNFRGIYVINSQTVDILNNTIGSTSVANSLVMNKNATGNSNYSLIQADNTGASASNISNNTLSNLQYSEAANAGSNSFYGIFSDAGTGNKIIDNNTINKISTAGRVGTVRLIYSSQLAEITNNKIGSQSSTDDIMLTSTRSSANHGIYAYGDFASKVTGNQVGGITIKATLATTGSGGIFLGIDATGSTAANLKTMENNIVGGTVANSIQSVAGGGAGQANVTLGGMYNSGGNNRGNTIRNITANEFGQLYGIWESGTVGGIVENNVIEQLTVNGQNVESYVFGIWNANTATTTPINGNTISGLKSSNAISLTGSVEVKHVGGIVLNGTGIISNNKIFDLQATGAGATSVVGIAARSASVIKNRVYDLKSSNGTGSAFIAGIDLQSKTATARTASNNVVNINYSGITPVYGILSNTPFEGSDGGSQVNMFYNTILLEGTSSGSAISSAIYRTNASPLELKNNLVFNNRSGGSGIHSLYGTSNTAPAWVSDYNFLASAGSNTTVGNWNGTAQNFAAWKAGHSGQDVNSSNDLTLTPSTFFDMTSGSNNFLKTTTTGKLKVGNKATTVAVTDDILGTLRAATPTIGAFEEVVVLPVTFKNFNAKLSGSKVNLNWNVGSESEIIRYEVERSVDGKAFVKVATVGAGQLNAYTAVDASPKLGINYYRLSAINADGTAVYFHDIREVKVASLNEGTALVYPNPLVGNTINVSMAAYSLGSYTYKLSDVTGKLLQKGSFEHKGGSNTITVNAAMPKGVYVLQVSNGREQIQAKLIKP